MCAGVRGVQVCRGEGVYVCRGEGSVHAGVRGVCMQG